MSNRATQIGFLICVHVYGGECGWQLLHVYVHLAPKELRLVEKIATQLADLKMRLLTPEDGHSSL